MKVEYEGQIHEFPDDFTDADVQAALSSVKPKPLSKAKPATKPRKESFGKGVAAGINTVGYNLGNIIDNSLGQFDAVKALRGKIQKAVYGDEGENFDAYRERNIDIRAAKRASGEANVPGEITGNILAGLPAVVATRNPWLAMAGSGALSGALGSESKDGLGVAVDVGLGSVSSLLTGGLLKGIGKAIPQSAKDKARQAVASVIPNTATYAQQALGKIPFLGRQLDPMKAAATRILMAAEDQTGLSGKEAITALLTGVKNARGRGSPFQAADTGDNLRALVVAASKKPGPQMELARRTTLNRQAGEGGRLRRAISDNVGKPMDPVQLPDDIAKEMSTTASPLYELANNEEFRPDTRLWKLLDTPAGKQAVQQAQKTAAQEMRSPNELGFYVDDAGTEFFVNNSGIDKSGLRAQPTLQTFDYVKRGFDDILEIYRNPTTGWLDLDEYGRAVEGTRKQLIEALNSSGPAGEALRQARAVAGDAIQRREAAFRGRGALLRDPEQVAAEVSRMPESVQPYYRSGMARGMVDMIPENPTHSGASRLVLGDDRRAILSGAGVSQDGISRLSGLLDDEMAMNQTFNRIRGGSPTYELGQQDGGFTSGLADYLTMGKAALATKLAGLRGGRMTPDVARAVTEFGLNLDNDAVQAILSRLSPSDLSSADKVRAALSRAVMAGSIPAGAIAGAVAVNETR